MKIHSDSLKNQYLFTASMKKVMTVDNFREIPCTHFNQHILSPIASRLEINMADDPWVDLFSFFRWTLKCNILPGVQRDTFVWASVYVMYH